jgi:16S rRNA (cytosine967-C5)-methyltransferase
LFTELSQADKNDYWKLVGVWCLWKNNTLPDWGVFEDLSKENFDTQYEAFKSIRKIRESIPDWLDALGEAELKNHWETELHALNEEARVVLRVNSLKINRNKLQQLLEKDGIATYTEPGFPDALILEKRQNLFNRKEFLEGSFEIQDAGSQLIAPYLQAEPGMIVIDACAGGGGKTLHLAALMKNKGRIISMDVASGKLAELQKRAKRDGAICIETKIIESSKTINTLANVADRVLLDVPCSGLGVIKRNPDAKWKLSVDFIEKIKILQQEILKDYSTMVKPGGLMVYSTCSLLPSENEKQVATFLESHKDFELLDEQTIYPSQGFDGFYMSLLKRIPTASSG